MSSSPQAAMFVGSYTPMVGHIRHPRPGIPWKYIGRTMPRAGLTDEGFGNPFTERNSDDPVLDYDRLLEGSEVVLRRLPPAWREKVRWINEHLVDLLDCDLLCWCHTKPFLPTAENQDEWECHGDPLLLRVQALKTWPRGEA